MPAENSFERGDRIAVIAVHTLDGFVRQGTEKIKAATIVQTSRTLRSIVLITVSIRPVKTCLARLRV